jgi:hypothetical protein
MSFINKTASFICITAFSGSMVVMGARDLQRALKAPQPAEVERAKKLIQSLRGDELFKIEAKYADIPDKPARKPGSVLPEYDLAKIKRFLSSLIGGSDTDNTSTGAADEAQDASTNEKP